MRVVIAPGRLADDLPPVESATEIRRAWRSERPGDELVLVPLSDGGPGLLDAVSGPEDRHVAAEVAGPLGHPVDAVALVRPDGTAVIEAARVCGAALLAAQGGGAEAVTTYGIGQLLEAVRDAGARRVLVGMAGAAGRDGGAGALLGLGFRVTVDDGGGLKVGAEDLHRVTAADPGWSVDWSDVEVVLLVDGDATFADGTRDHQAWASWADVAERDLGGGATARHEPGSGTGGGLGFGLRCGLPSSRFAPAAEVVADLVDLDGALADADLVVTGPAPAGPDPSPVVATVLGRARAAEVPVRTLSAVGAGDLPAAVARLVDEA